MKTVVLTAISAIGIVLMGCNNQSGTDNDSDLGSLKITINSETPGTGRASGTVTQIQENSVFSFAVCVFHNTSNALEAYKVFTNTLTGEIDDLQSSYTKRIVVLVNGDYDFLDNVTNYSQLTSAMLGIESQDPAALLTDGLFMSGEVRDVALTGKDDEATEVKIPVRRVVSKVILSSLTVSPDENSSLDHFKLFGVSVQKVPARAYIVGSAIPALAAGDYRGGITGDVSTAMPNLLYTAYEPTIAEATALTPNIYFYVFPNDNTGGMATLLTLYGEYEGNIAYYTFVINNPESVGTGSTDGSYITRNKVYLLNVTLKRLANYSDDPEEVSELADLVVTVVPVNWEGELIQNVSW